VPGSARERERVIEGWGGERERFCVNGVCEWVDPSLIKGVCDLEYESVRCCAQGQVETLWAVDTATRRSLCAEHLQ
jgi:hypothetical protein